MCPFLLLFFFSSLKSSFSNTIVKHNASKPMNNKYDRDDNYRYLSDDNRHDNKDKSNPYDT